MSVTGPQEDEGPKRGPPDDSDYTTFDWKQALKWTGILIAIVIAFFILIVALGFAHLYVTTTDTWRRYFGSRK